MVAPNCVWRTTFACAPSVATAGEALLCSALGMPCGSHASTGTNDLPLGGSSRFSSATRGEVDSARRVDVVLDGAAYPIPRASELALLEPLGAANDEPTVMVPSARVEDAQSVGDGHLKMVLRFGGGRLRCFGWEMAPELERIGREVSVVGSLRPDDWTGGEAVELRLSAVL